jgi:glycosyltransferase involved in cell wall biosynthesis
MSTDNTAKIIEKEIAGDDRFVLVRNQEKKFALRNIYEGILEVNPQPEDIIVTLDGDDWLSSADVLSYLNDYYNREDCWLTYGSYIEYPKGIRGKFARQIPAAVIHNSAYRVSEWCSSHLEWRGIYLLCFRCLRCAGQIKAATLRRCCMFIIYLTP